MTSRAGLLLGGTLLCLASLARAQDAAVEDATSTEDAAVVEDAAVAEDAAVVDDAAVVADAAVSVDAGTADDAAIVEDAAVLADAASGDAGAPCGTVTFIGECDGNTVRYCARDNQLVEIDCGAEYGSGATCGLVDCLGTDCRGYFCVARSGQACGEDLGCDVSANQGCLDGVCAASSACEPASFAPTCTGNSLSYCTYTVGSNDCSEGGTQPYVCGEDSDGAPACLGTAGGLCDLAQGYECSAGLECIDNLCTAPGSDAGLADSGPTADAASGDDDDDDAGGCGCRAGQAGAPLALLLAGLLALGWRRRR